MKAVLIATLLLVSAFSLGVNHHKLTSAQTKQIESIRKDNTWGKIILDLSEMHMLAKGPLDELLSAISNLVSDLGDKTEKANVEFDEREQKHNSLVQSLTDDINTAQVQIAHTETFLANVLYVTKTTLEDNID
jgi:hypothetical protein